MIPATPISFWQNFDFISIGAIFLIITALIAFHKKTIGILFGTISETIAHTPSSSLIFSIGMTIFFPLYYIFMYFWVGPRLVVPIVYYQLLIVSAVCEMIFVWVPAVPGKKNIIHSVAAGIVGSLMFVMPFVILTHSQHLNNYSKYSIIAFVSISLIMLLALCVRRLRRYTFTYEALYCLMFFVCMSIIAHS